MKEPHQAQKEFKFAKYPEKHLRENRRTILFFFIFAFFSSINSFGQGKSIDSLKSLLATERTDTGRITLLINMGSKFGFGQPKNDSAPLYLHQALALSKKISYIKGEVDAGLWIANYMRYTGNYNEAIKLSLQNLKLAEQYQQTNTLFFQTRLTGWIYADLGDFNEQLKYAKRLSVLAQPAADKQSPQEYDAIANNCIAKAFKDLQMADSALNYELAVYAHALKTQSPQWLGLSTIAIADILFYKDEADSALLYYKMGIPYAEESGRRDYLAHANIGLAKLFYKKGLSDSALHYTYRSFRSLQSTDAPKDLMDTYSLFAELYRNSRQYDSAYKYLKNYVILNDSLNNQNKKAQALSFSFNETLQQQQLEQERREIRQQYQNRIKLYSLGGIVFIFLIIGFLLYRNNRNKRNANVLLSKQNEQIQNALSELKSTQSQLIQSEKMASLGELTAGIAHEIQNPLNFVNNFSEINSELAGELKSELATGNTQSANEIAEDIKANSEKIIHHGKRADAIVKSMLQHSRTSPGKKEPTDINALADEYLRLSYHGMRAKDKSFNCAMETHFDETLEKLNVVPQDIGRVLLNFFNNAFYACAEQSRSTAVGYPLGGVANDYVPTVTIATNKEKDHVSITVRDNGKGIPEKIKDKIFQPFFTTKPTGSGTGLGLSLSYDIITKVHNGVIQVESEEGSGTAFKILLPIRF